MEEHKKIIEKIENISGQYSPENVFTDWIQCCALSIQNACWMIKDKVWTYREEQYRNTITKYGKNDRREFSNMLRMLGEALEYDMTDILGDIYMRIGCSSARTGQFFTPMHICRCITDSIQYDYYVEKGTIELSEPSVGSGGMIIAVAKTIKENGGNYQKLLRVKAQDMDWRSVYMTYVQMSLLGIDAVVVQGNTLADEEYDWRRILYTPKRMGMLF